jgi:hypothetical protein
MAVLALAIKAWRVGKYGLTFLVLKRSPISFPNEDKEKDKEKKKNMVNLNC